jgi:membrane fusion protein (multidrug efflux system)
LEIARKRKWIYIASAIVLVLAGVIFYRIYMNIAANKERAGRVSQGRVTAVEAAVVGKRDITPQLTFSANLEPEWVADISAKVDGRIAGLYVDEGDFLSGGSVIALLDTDELAAQVLQAEGSLLSNRASLEQAELELRRTAALADQGALSAQSLDNARTKRDLYIGQVRAAEGNLSLLQTRLANANVLAPRDGIVVKRYVQSGAYVKTGNPIISLANVASLLAKATVGEAQIGQITVGSQVKVTLDALAGQEFAGTVTRISPAAAVPARTFIAEVTISNAAGILKPGMFAKVNASGTAHQDVVAVPEQSLVMREDQKTVFVITADNKVQQRILKLGYVGGGWAEVLEGVQEGERIVVSGQNKIKDGAAVQTSGAGEGGV